MRGFLFCLIFLGICSCSVTEKRAPFTSVQIEILYEDSISIRAIEIMGNSLAFAANKGTFGAIDLKDGKVRTNEKKYHTIIPEFRAVAHTATDFFMLSVGNPGLLYKTGGQGRMDLVYMEEGEGVFYDAMTFWNDKEGVAVGDSVDGCLSIIITRDGGNSWQKIPCTDLPEAIEGEGAFAASNTNIKTIGDQVWIATTKRVLYSKDKGNTWEVMHTPIEAEQTTSGIYSIDFYDENVGIAFGGDYTRPRNSRNNKAMTKDGGKSWYPINEGNPPGYRSCVQFVPNTNGTGIIALGFEGIDYSSNMGKSWTHLSDESFYTFRFLNDSVAYAAGKNRIAKLTWR
ncbi:oxidoreductase [Flavobacteriaceae bacterium TP-CH-4]|uniref:Oxidoreductase n=1 Tax=Pelagihabitans pacificus TaxID=2696054 RepID=A0A967E6A3_9FLAO|nr:oxidoreductase [Pelagihabitans pacificus]NHF59415.1 oxidoreductase [Pelagihabitans pacificus]